MDEDNRTEKSLLLGEIMTDDLLDKIGLGKGYEVRILEAWRAMFGDTISKYMGRIYVRDGVLYMQITSSVLRQDLFMQREQLREKLNEAVGRDVLHDIVFL